jgi:hypothetical protein
MPGDYEEIQRRKNARIQSVFAYIFGTLILLIGVYMLAYEVLGLKLIMREPSSWDKLIGAVFILYGAWRIYKGYKLSSTK